MLETARRYRRYGRSPVQETSDLLRKIQSDPCNAFITVDSEGALRDAAAAEKVIESGSEDVLAGIPVAIKDNICVKGIPATCGSNILSGFVPPYDATVIAKLRERGAVILGKTNLDEFAMGSTTSTGSFGPTLNPWDHARTPGGSSGGSAAAVAAGLCSGALGSDTGGSIRMPASFCGITSLKPTYGSVSRYGLVAFASSLDQIGPMAPSARDVAILFDAIKGHDGKDSTSVPKEYGPTDLDGLDLKGVRIGVPAEFFGEGLDPDVERAVRYGISTMEELGARIREISLPRVRYGVAVYYIIATAEASSNLARYDGVRYGSRSRDAGGLLDLYLKTRSSGFGDEVKRRIMLGTYALSAGYYDAYYGQAQKVRTLIKRDFERAFEQVDVLATPVAPSTAFRLGEHSDDPLAMYLEDVFTLPTNLAGVPGLAFPVGFDPAGLPIGMQLMGPHFREDVLFRMAHAYQQVTDWHRRQPSL